MSENQEQQAVSSEPLATPQAESTPVQAPQVQEHMLPQSEVNRIVSTQKKEAYEKGLSAAQQQAQTSYAPQQPAPVASGGMDQMSAIKQELESLKNYNAQSEQKRTEEVQLKAAQTQIDNTISALNPMFETAQKEIEGFDTQKVADVIKFDTIDGFNLAEMAAKLPNGAHVLHELSKTPMKMVQMQQLRNARPDLAASEMHKLSQSIINNQQGKNQANQTPDPLNQIKSSNVGGNEPTTIAEFKTLYKA